MDMETFPSKTGWLLTTNVDFEPFKSPRSKGQTQTSNTMKEEELPLTIRKANLKDVPKIIELLADDKLGKNRESPGAKLPQEYFDAFAKIEADKNQELIVVEREGEIIGTLQLSFIQYLTHRGSLRAQIEGVRIRSDMRSLGIGKSMIEWAVQRAKERKAHMLQLTTDKQRKGAIAFYLELGFQATHEGMKLIL